MNVPDPNTRKLKDCSTTNKIHRAVKSDRKVAIKKPLHFYSSYPLARFRYQKFITWIETSLKFLSSDISQILVKCSWKYRFLFLHK